MAKRGECIGLYRKAIICPILKYYSTDPRVPMNYRGVAFIGSGSRLPIGFPPNPFSQHFLHDKLTIDRPNKKSRDIICSPTHPICSEKSRKFPVTSGYITASHVTSCHVHFMTSECGTPPQIIGQPFLYTTGSEQLHVSMPSKTHQKSTSLP
jgi:hypothetical protein